MSGRGEDAQDPKALVARGYDACGEAYTASRADAAPTWLAVLADRLPDGAAVLDVGCGGGVPVARALARRFAVTGVDISAGQIERARRNVPSATFLHGDIAVQAFPPATFDAVTMIYALFHLPREEHAPLLARLHGWLKPGGWLLATLAREGAAAHLERDFFGAAMYWSHFGEADYEAMLRTTGFAIAWKATAGHGFADADAPVETHPLILACKTAG